MSFPTFSMNLIKAKKRLQKEIVKECITARATFED